MLDWERLKLIKRIIIAVDNDGPGKRLAEELVRRLGRIRCYWVEYPEGCKDLNEVLMTHGQAEVARVLNTAKAYPVNGLYALSEFPPEPAFDPRSTGWARLDDNLMVYYPCFMVVLGFAGAGKTSWANQLVSHLALTHGWRAAIASYEMRLDPYVTDTLRSSYLQKPKPEWTPADIEKVNAWIEDNFMFISPSHDEDQHDVDWLIERAQAAVIRHGIRVLLIDPWNEIEHSRKRGENETDYTGRAIQALKRFGREFDCLVIVVAHPTKEGAKKKPEDLSLYDVSGTAHFANKADLGVVIIRMGDYTRVLIRKVRVQPDTGRPGELDFSFIPELKLFAQ
jgi:twinkle protein